MGYTEQDAMAELADMDMADEAAEAHYREMFGDEVTANELNAYAMWLYPGLQAAEALNKSAPRAAICGALAGMPNYMIDSERDEHLELPGVSMLEAITPPLGDPAWGSYGRPKTLFHHLHRMEGNDRKGRPVDLIETGYYPSEPDAVGKVMKTHKLTRTGILYAHIHGYASKDDVARYWRHDAQGLDVPATNHHYLALVGQEPPPDDSIYQYETAGSAVWGLLDFLKREDLTVPERYRQVSGSRLSKALQHVYANEPAEAMKLLAREDQERLCADVLIHSRVDNVKVREDLVDGLMKKDVTYAQRVHKLVEAHQSAHPNSPSDQVIGEMICRAVWTVIRRVMDFRMADGYENEWGHTVDLEVEPLTRQRLDKALAKIEALKWELSEEAAEERAADDYAELQGEVMRGS